MKTLVTFLILIVVATGLVWLRPEDILTGRAGTMSPPPELVPFPHRRRHPAYEWLPQDRDPAQGNRILARHHFLQHPAQRDLPLRHRTAE